MYVVVRSDGNASYFYEFEGAFWEARPFVDTIFPIDYYILFLADKILEALK